MKLSTCLLCTCLFSLSLSAQKEANHWYFGDYMGLDFSDGEPKSDLLGSLGAKFGGASISDKKGQLLFYANSGPTTFLNNTYAGGVYNKHHQLMPNGTLQGGTNIYGYLPNQSALILPAGTSSSKSSEPDSKFYLFNLEQDPNDETVSLSLKYSIIDLSLEGGNGDVVVKQLPIADSLYSGMSATIDKGKNFYWLAVTRILHRYDSLDAYLGAIDIYRVEPSGIFLHSTFQTIVCVSYNYIKFSPNGKYLHLSGKVYDFDNEAGVITGDRTLAVTPGSYCYVNGNCAEFSADSRVLYVFNPGSSAFCLAQFDLESSDLPASVIEIEGSGGVFCDGTVKGSMQLAPNGKIYISHIFSSPLSVIEHPEILGTGCDFELYKLPVERAPWWEFPHFPTNFLAQGGSVATLDISDSNLLDVFPNPTNGLLNINMQQDLLSDVTYNLTDQLGRLILTGNLKTPTQQIDLGRANAGVFYLSICSPKRVITKKLIKH